MASDLHNLEHSNVEEQAVGILLLVVTAGSLSAHTPQQLFISQTFFLWNSKELEYELFVVSPVSQHLLKKLFNLVMVEPLLEVQASDEIELAAFCVEVSQSFEGCMILCDKFTIFVVNPKSQFISAVPVQLYLEHLEALGSFLFEITQITH